MEYVRLSPSRSTQVVIDPSSLAFTNVALFPALQVGASLAPVTAIVNVWPALVSSPPLSTPPLSWAWSPIVADPLAFGASV